MENEQFARTAGRLQSIKTSLDDGTKHYFSLTTFTERFCYLTQQPNIQTTIKLVHHSDHCRNSLYIKQCNYLTRKLITERTTNWLT